MIDEIKLSSAFIELQKAVQHKNDDNGGKYIKKAIEILDESLSSDTLVDIISAANYEVKEYGLGFIKSGVDWVDSCIGGGIRKEELMIVGGEWHSGKTHMLRYLASQYMIEGLSVLDFNGEDMLDDIVRIYHNTIVQATGEKPALENLYFVNAMDADIIWYIESPITGSLYLETRKGRGRKILEEHKKIVLSVDWGNMIVEPENF